MASRVTQRQQSIRKENSVLQPKKSVFDGSVKNPKTAVKKSGILSGTRKPLGDITNKNSLKHEVSSVKKSLPKEEVNVAEERFLHDHKKCIEEQLAARSSLCPDILLLGDGSLSTPEDPMLKDGKADSDSPRYYPEPEELPMSEFSNWLESTTRRNSPACSPISWDSPPSSPSIGQFEDVELVLKDENDA